MAELKTKRERPVVSDAEKEIADWTDLLHELIHRIQGWLPKEEWSFRVIEKEMGDSLLGEYKAPGLLMQKEFTRILMEPIARFAPGADGVVDIYKMPAYDDIANLYRINGEWKLHYAYRRAQAATTVREAESLDLNEDSFLRALGEMTDHAR